MKKKENISGALMAGFYFAVILQEIAPAQYEMIKKAILESKRCKK